MLPASLVGPPACRCSWLSECQRGAAILAAPSRPHRTLGEESNTCDEMCANRCARSWPLFLLELGDVPAGVRANTAFQSPDSQRPNRCLLPQYSVFTSSSTPATHDRWIFTRRSSQSKSPHFSPSVSLTRSPRQAVTMHIVLNGSDTCSMNRRNSSIVNVRGSRSRLDEPFM